MIHALKRTLRKLRCNNSWGRLFTILTYGEWGALALVEGTCLRVIRGLHVSIDERTVLGAAFTSKIGGANVFYGRNME